MRIFPKNLVLTLSASLFFFPYLKPLQAQAQCGSRLIGFYTYYNSNYRSTKIPFNQLTHICHAFVNINPDGSITAPSGYLEPYLITTAHANGVRVLTSIGGADVTTFSGVAANPAYTATFVNQVYQFIQTNGYDGVDIDWEFPETSADLSNEAGFFQALRNKFNSSPTPAPSWDISFDIEGNSYWGAWQDYSNVSNYVSFYNVMSYSASGAWADHTNHNTAIYTGTDPYGDETWQSDVAYLTTTRGVPPSKINMGVPFYGVQFPSQNGLYVACGGYCPGVANPNYSQLVPLIGTSATRTWDSGSLVPYLTNGPGFITYDDTESVTIKVNYALGTAKLGGLFIWELSQDYMADTTQPLLSTMYTAVQALGIPTCTPTITPTPVPTATPYVVPTLAPPVLYANPVTIGSSTNLQLPMLSSPSNVKIQLFTVAFRKVQDVTIQNQVPGGPCACVTLPINLIDNWGNTLANGLYYVVITDADGTFTQKLLILK